MFTRKTLLAAALVLPFGSAAIAADTPKLGKPNLEVGIGCDVLCLDREVTPSHWPQNSGRLFPRRCRRRRSGRQSLVHRQPPARPRLPDARVSCWKASGKIDTAGRPTETP